MNNKITLIVGKKGSGKSLLGSKFIKSMKNKRKYNVIIDTSEKMITEKGLTYYKLVEINQENFNKNIDYKKLIKDNKNILFKFRDLLQDEIKETVNKISYAIYLLGNTLLTVDEAYLFAGKYKPAKNLLRLIYDGRDRAVDQIYITQVIKKLNSAVINNFDNMISFKQVGDNAISRAKNYLGVKKGVIQNLKKGEYIIRDHKDNIKKDQLKELS